MKIATVLLWAAIITAILLAIVCFNGCTTDQLREYQSHVDSRSVEGYGKQSTNGTTSGGVKYTVHYR